jgi:hypothetical protein
MENTIVDDSRSFIINYTMAPGIIRETGISDINMRITLNKS